MPKSFKIFEVIPVYKKDEPYYKSNYRPTSMLSSLSKICERYMHDEMNACFNDISSKFQCGFHKGFCAQHCVLYMLDTIRKTRDAKA